MRDLVYVKNTFARPWAGGLIFHSSNLLELLLLELNLRVEIRSERLLCFLCARLR